MNQDIENKHKSPGSRCSQNREGNRSIKRRLQRPTGGVLVTELFCILTVVGVVPRNYTCDKIACYFFQLLAGLQLPQIKKNKNI